MESFVPAPAIDQQALIFARELAQLQGLRREYERLVPAALRIQGGGETGPVVRTATVLFTDLRGFTHLTERYADAPSFLLQIVNEHLEVVVGAITVCGGVVEKYVGDGVMATFGARSHAEDHRQRAIAAALGIVRANEGLNRRRAHEWGFRLELGVSAASGQLVIGRIGPSSRSELGVLGDPINVASRLVSQAAASEVLLEASVYRGHAFMVEAEDLGAIPVRGRSSQIEAYRIDLFSKPSAAAA